MRESDFCIPSSNKAVISITPSWYDRRALDTHSDYALYSSLSHLANLAQSSPKVRESLACDGGLERITRILKEGKVKRIPESFQLSKWQQALLCVVNIGVRGSESVRNRVVESDIVPVLVTVLCNALENIVLTHRQASSHIRHRGYSAATPIVSDQFQTSARAVGETTGRRTSRELTRQYEERNDTLNTRAVPESTDHITREQVFQPDDAPSGFQATRTVYPSRSQIQGLARIDDSWSSTPPQASSSQTEVHSLRQPSVSAETTSSSVRESVPLPRSGLQSAAVFFESDLNDSDSTSSAVEDAIESRTPVQRSADTAGPLPVNMHSAFESEITPRLASQIEASISVPAQDILDNDMTIRETQTDAADTTAAMQDRAPTSWDQDVIWSLRLLAYLSKYPYLRPEFSRSHDVPSLRQNLKFYDAHTAVGSLIGTYEPMDEDLSDTLRLPFNIFQLVEKFTMRIHADESTYWAGVIMRNSCRRHDVKGGVRQCAYLECGKWEEKNKQFAKCRRCRRTKYCSKACQSKAWKGHRYWCTNTSSPDRAEGTVHNAVSNTNGPNTDHNTTSIDSISDQPAAHAMISS